ncbi:MarR family winged helix-turn-helix transcriptional regulator [Hymenobacter sp. PAMC 26628]|uniref:MarR family winged helix-turn-helix transcriptional regulator n=1 Tax=Hymenobacter sp. PAMC 26628 TaxID=1484118 RepID=UPI00077037F5|nr:MarR family transcriptional regulator [Hymenobacter sp. PAMC 26628]AMJ64941.1 transcriptional regulator [Hymenobacter sp. PAMC 26628]
MRIEDEIKQPVFRNAYEKAIINLTYTAGWLEVRQAAVFKPFGLTLPQFNVLRILRGQHPRPATVALLIDRMLDKTSNASRIVDRLVEKQFVTRTVCPSNRRAVDIRITEAGLALLSHLETDNMLEPMRLGMGRFSEEELQQFNELLDKMRATD